MSTQSGFYAVLPANVRRDNRLTPGTRLIFAELTAMCIDKPYCWPSNSYLAELYQQTERNIQRCLRDLNAFGYIRTETDEKNRRLIHICVDKNGTQRVTEMSWGVTEMSQGGDRNVVTPPDKNVTQKERHIEDSKRTSISSFDNDGDKNDKTDFEIFWEAYPKKKWKPDSLKAWNTRSKKAGFPDLPTLLGVLEVWKNTEEWQRDGGQYIPGAAKWLRNDGWTNEISGGGETPEQRKERLLAEIS